MHPSNRFDPRWIERERAKLAAKEARRILRRRHALEMAELLLIAAAIAPGLDASASVVQRRRRRLAGYGLTLQAFAAMVDAQGGACAICGDKPRAMVVDHCHASGRVRALLCSFCNSGLGMFRDDTARMRAAIDYLDAHRG